jgi:low affinity Fe/Cu permease
MQSRIGLDLADSLVMSVLLFVTLWIAGFIWSGFGEFFGVANSLSFALAYLVAHAVFVLLRDLIYGRTHRAEAGHPRTTT